MPLDLDALRRLGDPLLDPALASGAPASAWVAALHDPGPVPGPLADVRLPTWADPARLTRASRLFLRHAVPTSFLLGSVSLLECFAAARGARAVHAARTMRDEPRRRVGETGQFVLQIYGPGAWTPDGGALRVLLRVRLIHAVVRRRLLDQGWDETPLNQEDLLGTLFAFGLSPLLHLRALGVPITSEDVADTLHLWAVAGHVLGVAVEHLPRDEAGATALRRHILLRHFAPSTEGRALTASLLGAYAKVAGDPRIHDGFLALLRVLVGAPVCDALGVPRGAGPAAGRAFARGLGVSARGWDRLHHTPFFGRPTDVVVPTALAWHARRMAGGHARFEPTEAPMPAEVAA